MKTNRNNTHEEPSKENMKNTENHTLITNNSNTNFLLLNKKKPALHDENYYGNLLKKLDKKSEVGIII